MKIKILASIFFVFFFVAPIAFAQTRSFSNDDYEKLMDCLKNLSEDLEGLSDHIFDEALRSSKQLKNANTLFKQYVKKRTAVDVFWKSFNWPTARDQKVDSLLAVQLKLASRATDLLVVEREIGFLSNFLPILIRWMESDRLDSEKFSKHVQELIRQKKLSPKDLEQVIDRSALEMKILNTYYKSIEHLYTNLAAAYGLGIKKAQVTQCLDLFPGRHLRLRN